ncbi:strictosidine synthase [Aquibium carbonis]|uniref:Strictosidine synthase n=1 Tax=Aquibium carbonis TaxID=2495581 RepID=A0A3S0A732_9HYPH|nr:strictosidine synthase [Aquibium carbonis]RST85346.1 strictosidine synthase [Aquibium carbonis]
MIGGLTRMIDSVFGRGDAAVTVPSLDGALRPNRALDEATDRASLQTVDCLAMFGDTLVASAGAELFELGSNGTWDRRTDLGSTITCIASLPDGIVAALQNGDIVVHGGVRDGRRYRLDPASICMTDMAYGEGTLYVAVGSATKGADAWQRDLLERNASGSIWRIDLDSGSASRIAAGLAWPAGVVVDGNGLVFSEAWQHRLARVDLERADTPRVLIADLPGYPGRLSKGADGFWLAMFAPRSQLVEFVLREPAYRSRMMAEVPEAYWVAPRLRSGRSFYESLQGGGVKHLGILKPWAPTMSAGLCVQLDRSFQPRSSLQSRADGATHGVTCAVEHRERLFIAARGDDVIVSVARESLVTDREDGR